MSETKTGANENETLMSVILDHVPALVYLRDREGRFQLINARYEAAYGVKREDVIGRKLHDVLPKKYADLYAERDLEILQSGKAIEHETRLPSEDGERIYAAVKFPIQNTAGEITSVGGISFDITDHRNAEAALRESQQRLVGMMESSPIGASIVNVDGDHAFVNERMLDILGVSRKQMMRSKARDFYVDPTDRDRVYETLEKEGRARDLELHMKRADGTPFWALASFERADVEGQSQFFAWVYDITARKVTEQELTEKTNLFRFLGRIAEHANTATTFEDAIRRFLTDICIFKGWPVGHAYVRSTEGPDRLVPSGFWYLADSARFASFREVTENTEFTSGVGLPGRVMASGKLEWIEDVTKDKNFPRADHAADIGVRAGFAMPVTVKSDVVAVLEFYADTPVTPEETQLMTFVQVAAQLSRVAERLHAEEAQRKSEEQLRIALEHMPGGIRLVDGDLKNVLFNSLYGKLCNYPDDLLEVGAPMADEIRYQAERGDFGPGDPDELMKQVAGRYRRGESLSTERKIPGGGTLQIDIGPTPEGGFVSVVSDITARREAEEAVRNNEQLLNSILESSPVGAIIVNEDGSHEFVNTCMARMLGVTKEEFLKARHINFYRETDDRERAYDQLLRLGTIRDFEVRMKKADGTPIWALLSAEPTNVGDTPQFFAWFYDISERKRMELELQESRDTFQALADNLPEFITMKDPDGYYVFANKAFEDWTGFDRGQVIGKTYAEIYTPEQVRELSAMDHEVLESGKSFTREANFDYPDGNVRTVMAIRFPITSSSGTLLGLGHINHDITKMKQDEERLRRAKEQAEQALAELERAQKELIVSEKMASLGQLTAGIAHEIKNPLNFVNNFAETSIELIEELEEEISAVGNRLDGKARKNIDELFGMLSADLRKINEHGRRADGIVKSMLLHARGDDAVRVETPINPLVSEALHLAYHGERARDKSFRVTLDEQLADAVGSADLVAPELTRVLVNLFGNAFHAVKARAQKSAQDDYEPKVSVTTSDCGTGFEIRIRDNGTGIPEDARSKLFEPFFTTKPPGEGTGLGLSMCYDIVVGLHGGEVSFDSVVDEFTEFRILLPYSVARGS